MNQKTSLKGSKVGARSETHVSLFCVRPKGHISGRIERGLRKTKGIKGVTINPLTHTIQIRYDPNKLTLKEIRSILKKLHSDRAAHTVRKKRG